MLSSLMLIPLLLVSAWAQTPEADQARKQTIDALIGRMSLSEKIGQTAMRGKSSRVRELPAALKQAVREGRVGSLINITDPAQVIELQRLAVEHSPNGIPILFARDVIHGYKTIFPIPLGLAASFNPELIEQSARISAIEATAAGIKWTFAPMLDISRDARWGRIAESPGEDPYLASLLATAYVRGYQGEDLAAADSLLACAKHFAAYGAAEGGRDYNTVDMSLARLHNDYLPPFHAAVAAGIGSFMTGFNDLNGTPVTAHPYLLDTLLRQQWQFDGLVVSDWESVTEMIAHGTAESALAAARQSALAGLDMEMTSTAFEDHLAELIATGQVPMEQLDQMVRNILDIKLRAGLFETPYFTANPTVQYSPEHLKVARESVIESSVLLKNRDQILPLNLEQQRLAVFGPMLHAPHDQLGTWTFDGEKDRTITPLMTLKNELGDSGFSALATLTHSRDRDRSEFSSALEQAARADVLVVFAGEEAILSGEAHSRADLRLPGAQQALITELAQLDKPLVLVLMAGRPIDLSEIIDQIDAVLMTWHPGTMGGPAIVDMLAGRESPSGRLPVTWPVSSGQIPIYYNHRNTGRPVVPAKYVGIDDIPVGAWQSSLGNTSHYLDAGFLPAFPFGHGLHYSTVQYSDQHVIVEQNETGWQVVASVQVNNVGEHSVRETVQLYVRDLHASMTRPVRELKGIEKLSLDPGRAKRVTLRLTAADLSFVDASLMTRFEPGQFDIGFGPNAQQVEMVTLSIPGD